MSPRYITPTEVALAIALVASPCVASSRTGSVEEIVFNCADFEVTNPGDALQFDLDLKNERWMKFQSLVEQWKKERGARSSISEAAILNPYQRIIGMGEDAVPMILQQLKSEGDQPDQWFWALRVITDANPVDPADQGDFPKMAQAWLKWGEDNDYAG